MIKFFREKKSYFSWILWAVVGVFILFVFVSFGNSSGGRGERTSAAVVNGRVISLEEFNDERRNQEYRFEQLYKGDLPDELKKMIPRQAMSTIVSRALIEQEANRLGVVVTDEELASEISRMPQFQIDGAFCGLDRYRVYLANQNKTPREFESELRSQLVVGKLVELLKSSLVIPDATLEEEYRRQNERATIAYVRLPVAEVESSTVVSPAEVEAYYKAHEAEYKVGERRKIDYLLVDVEKVRQQVKVSEEAARARYDEHPADYTSGEEVHARHILFRATNDAEKAAAKAKAESAIAQLQKGADFAALAAKLSDDPGSRAKGGDLGFFERGQMVPSFEEAAFAAADGTLIDHPVESPYGYHVIQVLEHKPGGLKPFEEVRSGIEAQISRESAEATAKQRAESLAHQAVANPSDEALRALADPTGTVTYNTTALFQKGEPIQGLVGSSDKLSDAIFSLEQGKTTAEPIQVPRGFVIVKLAEIRQPETLPLDEIKDRVETAAKKEKAQKALSAKLEGAVAAANGDMAAAAKSLGVEVTTPPELSRNGTITGLPGNGRSLVREVFQTDVGKTTAVVPLKNGDAVIAKILGRSGFDPAAFQKEKEKLRDDLRSKEVDQLLPSILTRLKDSSTVWENEDFLKQLEG